MMDVLVYTVVLNLFVEYVDSIVVDSFTVSLLTAIVMKGMIDGINSLVQRARQHFETNGGKAARVFFGLTAWLVMFVSKIVILLVVQIIFEDDVDLGGFLNVLILVTAMMAARKLASVAFVRLGGPKGESLAPQSSR